MEPVGFLAPILFGGGLGAGLSFVPFLVILHICIATAATGSFRPRWVDMVDSSDEEDEAVFAHSTSCASDSKGTRAC